MLQMLKYLPVVYKLMTLNSGDVEYKSQFPDKIGSKFLHRTTFGKAGIVLTAILGVGTVVGGVAVGEKGVIQHLMELREVGLSIYTCIMPMAKSPAVLAAVGFLYSVVMYIFGKKYKTKGKIVNDEKGNIVIEK